MATVENLCQKGILLNSGSIVNKGDSQIVINYYLQSILPSSISNDDLKDRKNRTGNGKIKFTKFYVEDTLGNQLLCAKSGMDIVLVFEYECFSETVPRNVDIGFSIHSQNDTTLFVFYSSYVGCLFNSIPLQGKFKCYLSKLPLKNGIYRVGGRIVSNHEELDWPKDGLGYLDVEAGDFYQTGSIGFEGNTDFLIDGKWNLDLMNCCPDKVYEL
jgi:lipopolysaccharide transport system ATP-binding protein